jgi:uncharacterized protein with HEPN domain
MAPSAEDRLRDILLHIAKIARATSGMNADQFAENELVRAATERFFGIICEAALRLPDDVKRSAKEIDWRAMNDFGNVLKHGYHSVKLESVWDILQHHIPPLKAFVESRLRE